MKRIIGIVSIILAVLCVFSCANAEWWQEKKAEADENKQEYYETLCYGDRGARVRSLKLRLYELGYNFEGSDPDDKYNDLTQHAVRRFQRYSDMRITGIADNETQQRLYSDDAVQYPKKPVKSSDYREISQDVSYRYVANNAESHKGKKLLVSGIVLSVDGNRDEGYDLRVAIHANYNDVAYVRVPAGWICNIYVDDLIDAYSVCTGSITYTSVQDKQVTLPSFETDWVSFLK